MKGVQLEHLIALNREMSALAAAGIPLAEGLTRVSRDFGGPTSALAQRLAQRIESGQSLVSALDQEGDALPETYRAIVRTGLKSGRLTSALEAYSQTATQIVELRQILGLALLYPGFVLFALWTFFIFLNNKVIPKYDWLDIQDRMWIHSFRFYFFEYDGPWKWLLWSSIPLILACLVWLWWRRSSSPQETNVIGYSGWLGWIPGIARVRHFSCQASFAGLLKLLVEQRIPISEAIPLAAQGSGLATTKGKLMQATNTEAVEKPLDSKSPIFQSLPPLVRLAFLNGRNPDSLVKGLEYAMEIYHDHAKRWARGIALFLPVAITTLIGGTSVALYAVLCLQPYIVTLYETSQWYQ